MPVSDAIGDLEYRGKVKRISPRGDLVPLLVEVRIFEPP
jgi:hypothetical protein